MVDFLNGIVLAIFGGINLVCCVCREFAQSLAIGFGFLGFIVAEIFDTISKLCTWIMHKQKPESFFDIYKKFQRILNEITSDKND